MSDGPRGEEGRSGGIEEAGTFQTRGDSAQDAALYVVVGSDGLHEHTPRGRWPRVACDPVPADVLH